MVHIVFIESPPHWDSHLLQSWLCYVIIYKSNVISGYDDVIVTLFMEMTPE